MTQGEQLGQKVDLLLESWEKKLVLFESVIEAMERLEGVK